MSKPANKTMIGAFVLGAITLVVIAVAVFGSGRFFKPTHTYETYFTGSVKGLNVGAPVMFRGVQVGSVKEISLLFNPEELAFHIPVIFDIYPDKAKIWGRHFEARGQLMKPMIDKGLRTQLVSQSFITGQLAIALDFFPDKPPVYVGLDPKFPEIPSVPSVTEEFAKTLEEMPLKEIVLKIDSIMASVDDLMQTGSVQDSLESLDTMISDASEVMNSIQAQIAPLSENLQGTSAEIRSAVAKLDGAMNGDGGLLESSKKSIVQAEQTLQALQQIIEDNSATSHDLGVAVNELSRSMRSLRALSDYLERHPESVIRGKRSP